MQPTPQLIELLQQELAFLRSGGYARSSATPWRVKWMFIDSTSCAEYCRIAHLSTEATRCAGCPLLQLVPVEHQRHPLPCHHIAINSAGETIDAFERLGNQKRLEEEVERWIVATLDRLSSRNHEPADGTPSA